MARNEAKEDVNAHSVQLSSGRHGDGGWNGQLSIVSTEAEVRVCTHTPLDEQSTVSAECARNPSTSFSEEFVEELRQSRPDMLVWLESTPGVLFQGTLIVAYVLFETLGGLLTSMVLRPNPPPKFMPLPSSMIVVNSGLSILIGLALSACRSALYEKTPITRVIPKICADVFQWRVIIFFTLDASCFSIAGVFSMMAYSKLDAGLKKVLDQLKLPITAALGSAIVGKTYNLREWMALLIVLCAVCCFYNAHEQHGEITRLRTTCRYPQTCFNEPPLDICAIDVYGSGIGGIAIKNIKNAKGTLHNITTFKVTESKNELAGLTFSLVATVFGSVGSLISERVLKRFASTPFPTQKVQMESIGFPVALAMSFITPLWIEPQGGKAIWWTKGEAEGSGGGFFQGYTHLTLVAIAVDTFLAWMNGIIVKTFSAVVQKIAKCFILLLTVFVAGTLLKPCQAETLPFIMYFLAFITAFAAVLFATMPKDKFVTIPVERACAARESKTSAAPLISGAV